DECSNLGLRLDVADLTVKTCTQEREHPHLHQPVVNHVPAHPALAASCRALRIPVVPLILREF
ncbi:MAG: hypothetical protein WBA17_05450, partial [Saprospiraceae bacterium]